MTPGTACRLRENVFHSAHRRLRGEHAAVTDTEMESPTEDAPGRSWGHYGKRPAILLACVSLVDSIDRGILPGVVSEVQDDLGFSDTQMGALAAAFVIAGFLVVLPAGYIADRFSRTRTIGIMMLSWGILSAVTSTVRAFWQFLLVRVALGVGETVDNPAASSLMSDYYRVDQRGRAFAMRSLAPILGSSIGLGLGGLVGSTLGWRWAFLIVGMPGSLLAITIWRMPEPARGESDREDADERARKGLTEPVAELSPALTMDERSAFRAMRHDLGKALRIRTLRALMAGSAIAAGALNGMGFWASAFYERHTSLGTGGAAGVVAVLIAAGALAGTILAGRLVDRMRDRVEGLPMVMAGVAELVGSVLLFISFTGVPLWVRLPVQSVSVVLIVGGLLPLSVMVSEVVPATLRGAAYSLSFFLGALGGALSPLAIGAIADQFTIMVEGEPKGHLANAFLIVTPLLTIGSLVVLRGRRYVEGDIAAARAATAALNGGGSAPGGA